MSRPPRVGRRDGNRYADRGVQDARDRREALRGAGPRARALRGPFQKKEGFLEGPEHVITWAVGHLVQLAEPDAYDPKYKSWRMADLPIVPERFKLVVRDERSRKQMAVVSKQLARDDVEEVVNACDAGREGELIFAYLYEKAGREKARETPLAELDDDQPQ